MRFSRNLAALGAIGACLVASGCATPKYVTSITARGDTVKLLYHSDQAQGYVQCKAAPTGDLSQCVDRAVLFSDN